MDGIYLMKEEYGVRELFGGEAKYGLEELEVVIGG